MGRIVFFFTFWLLDVIFIEPFSCVIFLSVFCAICFFVFTDRQPLTTRFLSCPSASFVVCKLYKSVIMSTIIAKFDYITRVTVKIDLMD